MAHRFTVVPRPIDSATAYAELEKENEQLKKIVAQLTKIVLRHVAATG